MATFTASEIAAARKVLRAKWDSLKQKLNEEGRPQIEHAVQHMIRQYEKTGEFPLKETAKKLAETLGVNHPAVVPALMSLLSEERNKEYPRKAKPPVKKDHQPAALGGSNLPGAPAYEASVKRDGVVARMLRTAGEPMDTKPPAGGVGQPTSAAVEEGAPQQEEQKPPPPGTQEAYNGRIVSLKMAGENLESLRKGVEHHVTQLEQHIKQAIQYATDPRSHVDGPEKQNWTSRLKDITNGLKQTMKALEATADLAVSHL